MARKSGSPRQRKEHKCMNCDYVSFKKVHLVLHAKEKHDIEMQGLTLSKKSKPGKTKDDEFKISISTEDINKIDEKIKDIGVESEKGKTDEDSE